MRRASLFHVVIAILVAAVGAQGAPPKQSGKAFAAPGKDWSLVIALDGYDIAQNEVDPSGAKRYMMSSNDKTHFSVSFWIEPMTRMWKDSKACRKDSWAKEVKSPVPKKSIKMWELGDLAVVEYDVPLVPNGPVQKNYRAYMVHDQCWIDIHISKLSVSAKDEVAVRKLLESVHIAKGAAREEAGDVSEELTKAARLYKKRDYKQAAVSFKRVLDSEKKKRTLNEKMWRYTVDSLGMSYGMSGQLKKAEATFKHGISKDAKYAMFHYNLACTYAEMDDLDRALPCLEKAIQYKDNQIKGEHLPDPRTDSSFRKYAQDKRFLDVVRKLDG